MSRLATVHSAVNLGQGFPDFEGPDFVKEAAKVAIDAGHNQYAISHGAPRLGQAIAVDWSRSLGHDIDPDQEVIVTSGATEAIFDAIQAFIGPGDEIIAFEPFYDSYPAATAIAGGRLVPVTLYPPAWTFDLDALKNAVNRRTRVILLNTPHNPTGRVFGLDELRAIASIALDYDVLVITDEVYHRITYGEAMHISIASLPGMWERTLTINSTGKTFSMTGWKIGFAIGPIELTRPLRAVHQFVTFATSTPFQEAMATAFELARVNGCYERLKLEYDRRRVMIDDALDAAGLNTLPVEGSYFLMADVSNFGFASDVDFCRWLVENLGVAAVPPSAFYLDASTAPLLARFCFAKKDETLIEAGRRLQRLKTAVA
jgi:aspartate/methionine/tyrosine aminotransferase